MIPRSIRTAYEATKRQRPWWSAALIVGLILVLFEHAPIVPVIAGCVLAVAIAAFGSGRRVLDRKQASGHQKIKKDE